MDTDTKPEYTLLFDGGKTPFLAYGSFAYANEPHVPERPQPFLTVGWKLPVRAATHNDAEYEALLLGMRFMGWLMETVRPFLLDYDARFEWLEVIGDSKFVINQLNGDYAARAEGSAMRKLLVQSEASKLNRFFRQVTYRHVPRSIPMAVFHH